MKLQTASRKKAKIKMALQGPSGSGKTFSSLQVAYGLSGIWSKKAWGQLRQNHGIIQPEQSKF
jgi:hypothetical protein